MTKDEAIDLLADISVYDVSRYAKDKHEAIDMAIQALSQEPTFDDEWQKDMDEAWEQTKGKECPYPNNCPHPYGTYKTCIECKKNVNKPYDDAISREAVKDLFCRICMENNLCYRSKETCEDLRLFDELPSVTQKSGKWIDGRCNKCGEKEPLAYCGTQLISVRSKYCPNCGAKMESEE